MTFFAQNYAPDEFFLISPDDPLNFPKKNKCKPQKQGVIHFKGKMFTVYFFLLVRKLSIVYNCTCMFEKENYHGVTLSWFEEHNTTKNKLTYYPIIPDWFYKACLFKWIQASLEILHDMCFSGLTSRMVDSAWILFIASTYVLLNTQSEKVGY